MEVKLTCAYCKKTFLKKKHLVKKSKSGLRFCDRSCQSEAARLGILKTGAPRRTRGKKRPCSSCGKIKWSDKDYCRDCTAQKLINDWLAGDNSVTWSGPNKQTKKFVKKEIIRQRGDKCERCGFNERHDDGSSIIQMDHIDGDWTNNSPSNLKLLCPNCHALTETYGARNYGKGRSGRAAYRN